MGLTREEQEVIFYLWSEYCKKRDSGESHMNSISFGDSVYNDKDLQAILKYSDVHSVLSSLSKKGLIKLFIPTSGMLDDDFFRLVSKLEEMELHSSNKKIIDILKAFVPDININLIGL